MSKGILNLATFGLAGALLKPFGSGKKAAPAAADTPAVMPLADDQAVAAAKRRSILQQMSRGGRTSTMLTDSTDTLGG